MELNNQVKSQQSSAMAVKEIMQLPGWQILIEDLNTTRDKLVNELIESKTESERVRLQGEIKGINKILALGVAYTAIDTKA